MKVCKFGGTSVATAEQIKKVVDIVKSDDSRKIIVVSAPGKRFAEDEKVTDLLITLANVALNNKNVEAALENVVTRYRLIGEELGLDSTIAQVIEDDLRNRLATKSNDESLFMDTMKAAGEDNNAKLIAAYFNHVGILAQYACPKKAGLLVNERPERVQALPEGYAQLENLKNAEGIVVFPGFFGYTKSGTLRTFNRGGSDITGSIVAAAVRADLYENFTDVDSVFAANPKVVENPAAIGKMTYREMRELSYAGFSVFHDEALMPAFLRSVPVCIKNTNNPEAPGTMIVSERDYSAQPVIGIATDNGFSTLFVEKYLMNQEIGFGRRLLQILEDEGISFEHTPSGIDNMSVIIRNEYLTEDNRLKIIKRIEEELHADDVHFRETDYSMIVLVGEGMRHATGLTARAATAIARTGSNIEMINQGSSEVSLVFGVDKKDEDKILRELYTEFFQKVKVLA
ncbi:aspartate kinase [Sporosarcina pasteurii]|uniref:Aspartokinase n=1 Tax=Sporosarcina pasteurii TaxID=1474 RepID=A0A380BAF6_SPOPA|nr:aspartate kinase [Sporosarcina pasteurii]MDS9473363.1 aspartate kinase [Sporosarcina pasteurii]QBQ06553.1 aspartate kinase [Sporosarcina pasteurii]SUI98043.1 Aspartokinase I/homoserine dehydrogenase I [Sporosarcina pasteurii]